MAVDKIPRGMGGCCCCGGGCSCCCSETTADKVLLPALVAGFALVLPSEETKEMDDDECEGAIPRPLPLSWSLSSTTSSLTTTTPVLFALPLLPLPLLPLPLLALLF